MSEQEEEFLTLTDEDGFEISFRILGRMAWKGQTFAFLEDPEDTGSVMVFTVTQEDDGENFSVVYDEDLAEEVFYLFQADAEDYEVGPAE